MTIAKLQEAFYAPSVVQIGGSQDVRYVPTRVTSTYLHLGRLLGLDPLRTAMTASQFKKATQLDLSITMSV